MIFLQFLILLDLNDFPFPSSPAVLIMHMSSVYPVFILMHTSESVIVIPLACI